MFQSCMSIWKTNIFNIKRSSGRVMIMNQPGICDYSNYNYNDEFWKKTNREYEHLLEVSMVTTLLTKHADKKNTIMDVGDCRESCL